MILFFTIPGEPVGKGRARFAKRGNHMTSYTPEKTENYEALVKLYADRARGLAGCGLLEGPLYVHIVAFFSIPASMSKKQRAIAEAEHLHVTKKPDADNIAKIICDACNKVLYADDASISRMIIMKRYSLNPRVEVMIRSDASV